jgi:RHS repeat-associated protein
VNRVAATVNHYDGLGRLTLIVHYPVAGPEVAYGYRFDAASRITSLKSPEGVSSFAVDAADQLLSASLTGEAYVYDRTGNRSAAGMVVGAGNRLLSDGTFRYDYDREGNRTAKYRDADRSGTLSAGDKDVSVYGWDQRNRLVAVSHVGTWTAAAAAVGGLPVAAALPGSDLELRYTYDAFDRRIRRAIDADGVGRAAGWQVSFAGYQGDLRTLEIRQDAVVRDASGRVVAMLGSVVQRTLYGAGVDVVLAVERVAAGKASTWWTLGDHQGSIRDVVSGVGATFGRIVEHRQYNGFGKLLRRVASAEPRAAWTAGVGVEFGYAGRPLETRTGLSDNRARWYEPATGRFVSEDPSGFKGGDANLFRYAGNDPLNRTDPSGLAAKWAQQAGRSAVPAAGFAGLTGPALTRSGVGNVQVKASTPSQTASPTLSLAPATGQRSSPAPQKPFAHLMTTGRAAPPSQPPRSVASRFSGSWTLRDSEAKTQAIAAYDINDGGMLRDKGINYDPSGETGRYAKAGFSAHLSYSAKTGTYYLAFRGTERTDLRDWWADVTQGLGFKTDQYDQAILLAREVRGKLAGAKLIVTGHSLGAGMAAAASYAVGVDAILFNPPSLNATYRQGNPGTIRSQIIVGDILSVGRTLSNGIPDTSMANPNLRFAPGRIILHLPRSVNIYGPFGFHSMHQYPD